MTIFTIGHANRSFDELLAMLQAQRVEQLVDVRTAPGSRRNPQFAKDTLARELPEHGIRYMHLPELGGFRKPRPDSRNDAWRNDSFRGFADYMETDAFRSALTELMALAEQAPTAIMCAEAVPWRCHRSLIADALTARGIPVSHITSRRTARPHTLTGFARIDGDRVTYPATLTP